MEIFKLFKNLLKNEGGVDITALSKADSEFLGTLISQTLSIISLDKYQNWKDWSEESVKKAYAVVDSLTTKFH